LRNAGLGKQKSYKTADPFDSQFLDVWVVQSNVGDPVDGEDPRPAEAFVVGQCNRVEECATFGGHSLVGWLDYLIVLCAWSLNERLLEKV